MRFDKNTVLDAEFQRSDGRTFQAAGPATVNAPSANFVLVLTTEKFPRGWNVVDRRYRQACPVRIE